MGQRLADKFAAHLYRSRMEYRSACRRAGKSGKQIERCVISSFHVGESMGFKGEFRQWEDLLGLGNNGPLFRLSYHFLRRSPLFIALVRASIAQKACRSTKVVTDPSCDTAAIQVSAAFASPSQQAWCAPAASVMGMHESNPIQPVTPSATRSIRASCIRRTSII